jgi:hypothetical protein
MLTKSDLKQIKEIVRPLEMDIKTVKVDAAQTRKDVKVLISYFDREYVELRKRIERIEEHLDLNSKN